ncbi:MAG: small subunit ribosomal protein S10 [Parcubacteria group bacterium Athens1014_10]|nr:MAG: small subunit ribosomal protein S10 [Parcubacteria group bacterium Athens1014_10]TSD05500.1 MAG: small subunit ribosomal protein S10 [Parcubacteria group bacterium Athens0714_12]
MPERKVKVKEAEQAETKSKIRIKIKAYDHKIIDQATKKIMDVVQDTGVKIIGPVPLPIEKKIYTVLSSTFVKKDTRNQYEIRVHKRLLDILEPTPKTIESLTTLSLPAGVDVEIKM